MCMKEKLFLSSFMKFSQQILNYIRWSRKIVHYVYYATPEKTVIICFLKCKVIQKVLDYFKTILFKVCNITYDNMEQILFLDIKSKSKKHLNTIIILTVQYIATVWYNRARNTHIDPVLFETNIVKHHKLLSLILKDKMQLLFTEKYCHVNICLWWKYCISSHWKNFNSLISYTNDEKISKIFFQF